MSFSEPSDHDEPFRSDEAEYAGHLDLDSVLEEMQERFPQYLDDGERRQNAREIGLTSRALYNMAAVTHQEAAELDGGERTMMLATARAYERDADALLADEI